MKFSDYRFANELQLELARLGFNKPTDIQFKAIKPIMEGEDVFAIAPTGTGKTGAFAIPIIDRFIRHPRRKEHGVRCLIMVPTRELASQIHDVFTEFTRQTKIRSLSLLGGVEQESQINSLKKGVDVLITTPGRMFDLIHQGYIDVSHADYLVLDEADLMLSMGFQKDIQDVIRLLPKKRQTLFFSATINKKIKSLAYDIVRDAIRIQISPKNPVSKNVHHAVSYVEMDDKRFFLENLIKEFPEYKYIVFARTKIRVERVVAAMERVGIKSEGLHGGMEQKDRFDVLNRFRNDETNVLITTDVAARGIDIPNVDYVVNYDIPDDSENYVHRCGRTGRGNKTGQALAFCSAEEKPLIAEIEEYTGEEIEVYEITRDDYSAIIQDSEIGDDNWKKLIDEANKYDGTEDSW